MMNDELSQLRAEIVERQMILDQQRVEISKLQEKLVQKRALLDQSDNLDRIKQVLALLGKHACEMDVKRQVVVSSCRTLEMEFTAIKLNLHLDRQIREILPELNFKPYPGGVVDASANGSNITFGQHNGTLRLRVDTDFDGDDADKAFDKATGFVRSHGIKFCLSTIDTLVDELREGVDALTKQINDALELRESLRKKNEQQ